MKDERGLRIAAQGTMLIIPTAYTFTAERLLETQLRTGTADNDINAIKIWWLLATKVITL